MRPSPPMGPYDGTFSGTDYGSSGGGGKGARLSSSQVSQVLAGNFEPSNALYRRVPSQWRELVLLLLFLLNTIISAFVYCTYCLQTRLLSAQPLFFSILAPRAAQHIQPSPGKPHIVNFVQPRASAPEWLYRYQPRLPRGSLACRPFVDHSLRTSQRRHPGTSHHLLAGVKP